MPQQGPESALHAYSLQGAGLDTAPPQEVPFVFVCPEGGQVAPAHSTGSATVLSKGLSAERFLSVLMVEAFKQRQEVPGPCPLCCPSGFSRLL